MSSQELQAAIYADAKLNSTAKLVFVYLCAKADEQRRCVVSPARLARNFSRSKRTIQRAIATLRAQNLITDESGDNAADNQMCKIYTIRRLN